MTVKFSEDIVPISDLKANPGKIIRQVSEAHRPAVLTNRGRGVAVVQGLHDFEKAEEEKAFMKAVMAGMIDLEEHRTLTLTEVKERLKIG